MFDAGILSSYMNMNQSHDMAVYSHKCIQKDTRELRADSSHIKFQQA